MRDLQPKLSRVFRTTEELDEPEIAEVTGVIPTWLQGSLLRSGPGLFDLGSSFRMNHIFDGYAILSKFEFKGSEVIFHKRFLESDALQRALAAGKPTVCEYGTRAYHDPNRNFLSRFIPNIVPPLSDNCNMCVFRLGNRIFASSETSFIREIEANDLGTGDKLDSMKLFGLNSLSGHPLTDEETGFTYNVGPSMMTGLKYNILRIPPPQPFDSPQETFKKAKVIASVPSSWNGLLSFNHSFGMTRNYIVIIEQPYVFVTTRILGGIITKNLSIMDWLDWKSDLTNNFLVVDKVTGRRIKVEYVAATPFFFLHIINAYEENGHIVIDISAFPNANVLQNMTLENVLQGKFWDNDMPQGLRFVLPIPQTGTYAILSNYDGIKTKAKAIEMGNRFILTPEILTDKPGLDMPTINRRFLGRKYDFYYATGSVTNGYWKNSIAKIDIRDPGMVIRWRESDNYYVGEPVFVSNPQATTEDDGVVLSCVTTASEDALESRDFLVILDGKTMNELGRVYLKCHLPQGVHGVFIPKYPTLPN